MHARTLSSGPVAVKARNLASVAGQGHGKENPISVAVEARNLASVAGPQCEGEEEQMLLPVRTVVPVRTWYR